MHQRTDAALAEDCKRGDRRALEILVERYERQVFNAAYRMLGNADDAVDVSQNAFLKVFENIEKYDPQFKFFSWVYRITINESINQLHQRKNFDPLDESEVSEARSPEELLSGDDLSERMQVILMEMPESDRTLIVMKHFSGCDYHQIGEILQIPQKTVKSRLYSARQRMKKRLQASGILSP